MSPDETRFIRMTLAGQPSTVVVGPLAALELSRFVPQPPPVYVVDEAVATLQHLWLSELQAGCDPQGHRTLVLPGGEICKSMPRLSEIHEWLAGQQVARDGTVVGVGGGAVLDVTGLAAATWRRGVNFVAVPTTLLAMVDASIGGKTAVNAAGLKNPVGAFHPASGILVDVGFLASLARREWRNGMAELIKTAIVGDPELFRELRDAQDDLAVLLTQGPDDEPVPGVLGAAPWRQWIGRAAAVKADVVNRDFRERGPRRALNLGHTLGHAVEAWRLAGPDPLSHGEAVAIGMAVVFRIAADRGLCPLTTALEVIRLLEACGLPTRHDPIPPAELERLLAGDKKVQRAGGLRWVLPRDIGRLELEGRVGLDELGKWLGPGA